MVDKPLSRRDFFRRASGAATAPLALLGETGGAVADGSPEQIHLTWGDDPASCVVVSWASTLQATHPRVILETHTVRRTVHAVQRTYTDGMNGQTVFTYHARLDGLAPDTRYRYAVTADNDTHRASPFTAEFRTAPRGRHAFRWTSFGDLATPNTAWTLSSPQSRHAVDAVEQFQPLFHLMNGDLCYANLNWTSQPAVWADFGNNVQRSAAQRPWMPCPGNHEIEFCNGEHGFDAYRTRYTLPGNGTRFAGLWYRFQIGSVLFISLSADDVIYQDSGAFHAGPEPYMPAAITGNGPIMPGTSLYVRGYSDGAQTRWLEQTLAAARNDRSIDWIVVQMHQDALSSSKNGNGSDKGIRETWLPLFDRHEVDLVLCGHDHDYERSWPVRGCNRDVGRDAGSGETVDTCQPQPVTTSDPPNGQFEASRGTVHLVLGGGGTSSPLDVYGSNPTNGLTQAKVITKANRPKPGPVPGVFVKDGADAREDAIWSARRDTVTGYGIGVFDVEPDLPDGRTSITMRYFHAEGAPSSRYELFDRIVLVKDRRDKKS